jgi:hypothetical protein
MVVGAAGVLARSALAAVVDPTEAPCEALEASWAIVAASAAPRVAWTAVPPSRPVAAEPVAAAEPVVAAEVVVDARQAVVAPSSVAGRCPRVPSPSLTRCGSLAEPPRVPGWFDPTGRWPGSRQLCCAGALLTLGVGAPDAELGSGGEPAAAPPEPAEPWLFAVPESGPVASEFVAAPPLVAPEAGPLVALAAPPAPLTAVVAVARAGGAAVPGATAAVAPEATTVLGSLDVGELVAAVADAAGAPAGTAGRAAPAGSVVADAAGAPAGTAGRAAPAGSAVADAAGAPVGTAGRAAPAGSAVADAAGALVGTAGRAAPAGSVVAGAAAVGAVPTAVAGSGPPVAVAVSPAAVGASEAGVGLVEAVRAAGLPVAVLPAAVEAACARFVALPAFTAALSSASVVVVADASVPVAAATIASSVASGPLLEAPPPLAPPWLGGVPSGASTAACFAAHVP